MERKVELQGLAMQIDDLTSTLQAMDAAAFLRHDPRFARIADFIHLFSAVILLGAGLPLSLRMMGFWKSAPLAMLARIIGPITFIAFVLTAVTGALLFCIHAKAYAAAPLMQWKLGIIALAVVNALALRIVPAWRLLAQVDSRGTINRFRWAGFLSITLWSVALYLGWAINRL